MSELTTDLDAAITNAVNARVEAEMMKALSGDETIGSFVVSALRAPVEIPDGTAYGKKRVPFLHNVLRVTIQKCTQEAVQKLILEEMPAIEAEVRKVLRRNVNAIAESMAESLTERAKNAYGVKVDVALQVAGGY